MYDDQDFKAYFQDLLSETEDFTGIPALGNCVELARKAWFVDGNFEVARVYYEKGLNVLDGRKREVLHDEYEGVKEDYAKCTACTSLNSEAYYDYLFRHCDFHGLEEVGIHSLYDLWKLEHRGGRGALEKLINYFHECWERFNWEVPVTERRFYRNEEYCTETRRYCLTEACLQNAFGNVNGSRNALCIYWWRWAMSVMFRGDVGGSVENRILACLVWFSRLKEPGGEWEILIPVVACHLWMGTPSDVIRRIIEDDAFCMSEFRSMRIPDRVRREMALRITEHGLDGRFPKFNVIFSRTEGQSLGRLAQTGDPHDEMRIHRMVMNNVRHTLGSMSLSSMVDVARSLRFTDVPLLDNEEINRLRTSYYDYINRIADFIGNLKYGAKTVILSDIRRLLNTMGKECLLNDVVLGFADELYPLLRRMAFNVELEYAHSLLAPVELQLEHWAGMQCHVANGKVAFKIAIGSVNFASPSISLARLEVGGAGAVRKTLELHQSPLEGGERTRFDFSLPVSEIGAVDDHGTLSIRLIFVSRSEMSETATREFELEYSLEEAEFEAIENPYSRYCRRPAEGDFFVGRDHLLKEISYVFERDEGGQCYVLYGQRRSGKSSVMKNLDKVLNSEMFAYVNVSMQSIDLTHDILGAFTSCIEGEVMRCYGEDAVMQNESSNYAERLKYMGRYFKRNASPGRTRTLIVGVDEFTELYDYFQGDHDGRHERVRSFLRTLKALLEDEVFHLLLIGQEAFVQMQRAFPNEFAVLHLERLSYLGDADVRKLVDEPIRKFDKDGVPQTRYRENALQKVVGLTGGQPWFTQRFCKLMVDCLNRHEMPDVTEKVVDMVEKELCDGDSRIPCEDFHPFFDGIYPEEDRELVVDLCYELVGKTSSWEGWVPLEHISESLRRLVPTLERQGLLKVREGRVALRMGLLSSWLRANPGYGLHDFVGGF